MSTINVFSVQYTAAITLGTVVHTADITAPLSHVVLQEDGGQWVVGRILEGAALEDKREYQQMVSKWRSIAEDQDVIHQLEEV